MLTLLGPLVLNLVYPVCVCVCVCVYLTCEVLLVGPREEPKGHVSSRVSISMTMMFHSLLKETV